MKPDDLLTMKEAAPLLKHSPYTVGEWTRLGILKSLKIGRKVVIRRVDLEQFIHDAAQPKIGRPKKSRFVDYSRRLIPSLHVPGDFGSPAKARSAFV